MMKLTLILFSLLTWNLSFSRGITIAKEWGTGSFETLKNNHYRLKTKGKASPNLLSHKLHRPFKKDTTISFDIRVDRMKSFSGIEVRIADKGFKNYYIYSIPHFADPLFNIVHNNVWQHITFGRSHAKPVGNPDKAKLTKLAIYIQDNKTGKMTVDISNIKLTMPKRKRGIVSITFDDGYKSHYWATKEMAKLGLRGTAYIMPRQIGQRGYLTLEQLKAMKHRYRWGISAHHAIPLTEFAPKSLDKELKYTINYLSQNGFKESARHLAYPLGKQEHSYVIPTVKKYFKTARITGGGAETIPPSNMTLMRTYNVTKSRGPEIVMKEIREAVNGGQWIILMFHYLVDKPKSDTDYSRDEFKKIIKAIAKSKYKVAPVHEVADKI